MAPLPGHCQPAKGRFPFSRPELLREWVLNIGRGDFEPKQHTVICSEHFRPECFSAFGNRKNLKHNAVPTEFAFRDARQVSYTPTGRQGGRAASERQAGLQPGPPFQVPPAAQAREHGPERKTGPALGGPQPPPGAAGDPAGQVLPCTADAAEASAQQAGPPQPPDHSYALLDLGALKRKLFVTLKENEKLRKRLKAQRLVMRRLCRRLRAQGARGAHGAGRPGPRPEQQR